MVFETKEVECKQTRNSQSEKAGYEVSSTREIQKRRRRMLVVAAISLVSSSGILYLSLSRLASSYTIVSFPRTTQNAERKSQNAGFCTPLQYARTYPS